MICVWELKRKIITSPRSWQGFGEKRARRYTSTLIILPATNLDLVSTIAAGAGLAWASGLRLYAVVFLSGLLANMGYVTLPGDLGAMSHPLVIGTSGLLLVAEFLADKIPGFDSIWDAIHTFIRIPAGAVIAAASLGVAADPAWIAAAGLIGGALAGSSHFAKTGSRVLINTSPEPFSNWTASFSEEFLVLGALWLAFHHPLTFLVTLIVVVALSVWLIALLWRFLSGLFRRLSLRTA